MAESAAQALQRRHDELEGAPDPFPPISSGRNGEARRIAKKNVPLNTGDEDAFPSLASAAPAKPAIASAWSSAPRIRQATPRVVAPVFSDSFVLENIDLSTAGKDSKPTTLNEVLKRVMVQHKNVKLEASTQRKDGRARTSFVIKADSEAEVEAAKRKLTAALSPVVTRVVQSPVSAIGSIVGQKGANLNQLRAKYDVRVDIPRKDANLAPPAGSVSPVPADEDEEPTQPISVTGPLSSVVAAIAEIEAVIATKTASITQRVRDVPAKLFPFIEGRRSNYEEVAGNEGFSVGVNPTPESHEISVSGDRQGVVKTVEQIKNDIEELENSISSISMHVKKPKHRLLVGDFAHEFMATAKCAIELPEDPEGESITIWGLPGDLPNGLKAVNDQASSQHTQTIPIPVPSGPICEYLITTAYFGSIWGPKFPGVEGYPVSRGKGHVIDFIGDKEAVAPVVKELNKLFQDLAGSVRQVEIDWLLHKPLAGKFAKRIEQFKTANYTEVHFPEESEEKSTVLLVYDLGKNSSKTEKKKHLDEVERELKKLVTETGNVRSEEITVDKKWHPAIIGKNDSNLNAIIGEDKVLSIKFGSQARLDGDSSLSEDTILIRGPSSDVTRAVEAIKQLAEKAKNDELESSYVTEFDIPQEYARHIVGSGGSGINKLREQLDVRVDLNDDADKEGADGKKKGKKPTARTHVKITGRKVNADEAKKRILAQVDRLEDETSEVLKIPNKYHSGLIGSAGKYVTRLEEKYGVKINFGGEDSRGRGQGGNLGPDEVMVKGGKKGVASAKNELLEAYEYEKETNQAIEFTVPTRAVARILGRGGSQINEIKEDTNTQIDVEKADTYYPKAETLITVRGTKSAIADAKKRILAISSEVGEETTVTINIENKFHRGLIGAGGQGLRDLVAKVGGPSDSKAQAGLIRFPRNGDAEDEVTLRGEPALVKKLQKELEKIVAELRDRVVLGVDIPAQHHRVLIGRGGQHLNELQDRHNVTVQFPGSRSYYQIGEPENAEELADAPPENIVKVSGSRSACEKAMKEMSDRPAPQEQITTTITVPLRYVHSISQQGTFFRTLRQIGVQVDQSQQPSKAMSTPRPPPSGGAARIDEEPIEEDVQWQVTENHQDGEEGDAEWTLRGRDQATLDKAQKMVEEAIAQAQSASHVGFLTLADRSAFPRIVGTKGASVARLRNETGAEITVGREDNTIVIIGSESVIEHAKSKILDIVNNSARPRGGRSRDED